MIYEFKVTLKDVGVPVWRTIQIDGNGSFFDLHLVLQEAFDWFDCHLHNFSVKRIDGKTAEGIEISPELEIEEFESVYVKEKYDEKTEIIADWFIKPKDRVIYTYDFGDNWEHEIVLEKILEKEEESIYPKCVNAKNLAPEEDSRGEVIMGEVDLEFEDSSELIASINEDLQAMTDFWPKTLAIAKEFQKIKPWEIMADEDIFALEDPLTGEYLLCSVLGQADEIYGLAVYIGTDGFFSILDSIDNKPSPEIVKHQHSLLLSFEDRLDLEKEEYAFLKTYDVTFRGKKAWPSFLSIVPGFLPWRMDNNEARQMHLAISETLKMAERMKNGLQLPHIVLDNEILLRFEGDEKGVFDETPLTIEEMLEEMTYVDFTEYAVPNELEMKRALKNAKKRLPMSIEFQATYLEIPIQESPDERPLFPSIIIVSDHETGVIYHHDIYGEQINSTQVQQAFLNIFGQLGGIPREILTDHRTFSYITPVLEYLEEVQVELAEELPSIEAVFEEIQHSILGQLKEE